MNLENNDLYNGVWAISLIFGKSHKIKKNEAIKKLEEMGIPSRPFFYPLSSLPAYENHQTGSRSKNPNSYDISERGITLASHYLLTDEEIDQICGGIRKLLNH